MMSSKSSKSGPKSGAEDSFVMPDDVKKVGYMKKLKTMKKKYFVLRDNNDSNLGNICYYDSEKKFKTNAQPKRVIFLKDCFSINRKIDGKHDYAIALYTKEDTFATVVDNETTLKEWLEALIELQTLGIDFRTGHNIHYDHVWQVNINRNGLGQTRNMTGSHRLCLTDNTLYIVKVDPLTDSPEVYELPLISIRRCGHNNTSSAFFIELGRSSSIGPGDIWIQAEDSKVSQNMHEVILSAMRSSKNHEDFGPSQRPRSASTSDKPISTRRPQTSHTNQNMALFGTSYSSTATSSSVLSSSIRERCDSMPSRSRTTSESDTLTNESTIWSPVHQQTGDRFHSGIHGRTLSYSPPSHNPLSSATCSTDSAGSSQSIDEHENSHSFTQLSEHHSGLHNSIIPSEPPISEEDAQNDDYLSMSPMASAADHQLGVRSQLNLNIHGTNISPITSPTFCSAKSITQSREDNSPYMPMSPIGSYGTESLSSSRRSSGLEKHFNSDTTSEYMRMTSSQEITSDEYLNMAPLSQTLPKPSLSFPNSSLLKEEFHLEKVKTYFSPSDENDSFDYIPPVRAYSIGSRPQTKPFIKVNSKTRQLLSRSGTQTPEEEEEIRIRAFSMGSHANTREKRIAAKKQALIEAQIGSPTAPIDEVCRSSTKASSAPVLSPVQPRKRSATVGCRPVFNRSGLTSERSDTDLMEIDYSKSMQSNHIREKIEDRLKRQALSQRQRSNSRSSTSSSGVGSASTISPSMTSSMNELTDKKREMTTTLKTSDDQKQSVGIRSAQSTVSNDYLLMSPNPEPKLPSSHRPNTGQVSQQLPIVPSKHSSVLPQSRSKTLPTIQTNISKHESFAQKPDDNDSGDYVCLDIRSTGRGHQNVGKPSEDMKSLVGNKSVPKVVPTNDNLITTESLNVKIDDISRNIETVVKTPTSVQNRDSGISFEQTSDLIPESKTEIMSSESMATNTENGCETVSLGSTSTSRPSSTSSDKELNYASLDLAPSTSSGPNTCLNDLSGENKATSLSKCGPQKSLLNPVSTPPNSSCATPVAPIMSCCGSQELLFSSSDSNQLSYAEIDFGIGNKNIGKS